MLRGADARPRPPAGLNVLIVVESSFGNTMAVAEVLAGALRGRADAGEVTVVRTDQAPRVLPDGLDLLLVGAPTHAFTLPTPASRAQAVAKGAPPVWEVGVREWIADVEARPDLRVLTFDTSVRLRLSLGCAARAAARLLRRRGFDLAERGPSFYVTGTAGPLGDGEQERAASWAAGLVDRVLS